MGISVAGVALLTWSSAVFVPVNATTAGFAYLLLVLVVATIWGFFEAALASVTATLTFNYFFFPPVGRLTIADPQNWVALFSFLTTALVASRLSSEAKRRTVEAVTRQQDLERLYTFSRAILLIEKSDAFAPELVRRLAEVFELRAAVLFDRRTNEFYRAGPADFEGLDDQLRAAALEGTSFSHPEQQRTITAVRLGAKPIASLALQGARMPDSVLQGIGNLVAIGLERARAQELTAQVEAARQSEKLRTTLLDAMAHEFKTPLTSVIGATTALLDAPDQPPDTRVELLKIADEEAQRLKELIDDTIEMGRLDTAGIRLETERADLRQIVSQVIASMHRAIADRPVELVEDGARAVVAVDPRLMKLAIKQLVDNALKYSPPDSPVTVAMGHDAAHVAVSVTNHGPGIPELEQARIFDRMYRSPSVERRIPGSGLGLNIAQSIVRAHQGELTVESHPGETTFRIMLPAGREGAGG